MSTTSVLIVGAGPTGLNLALRLSHHGVPFRIVDRSNGPGLASRAMAVQARTLEFYDQIGLGDAVVARGIRTETAHVHEGREEVTSLSLKGAGTGISPYPFVLCFPQDDHERLLVEELGKRGASVSWNTALTAFDHDEAGVHATLDCGGTSETVEAAYLCGCDGAHTAVRPALGIGFPGGTYRQLFYVADVDVGLPTTGDFHLHVGPRNLALMLPVRSSGMWRLIGIVPPELDGKDEVAFEDVRPGAEALLGIRVAAVNWFSSYRVHHRVADRFRSGRAFIAGDAGHLHSPAGGQGMNTGIGDAVNLAWKLADVLAGRAAPSLLDSYEPERIAFARKLVETTDRAFEGMVGEGWTSQVLRDWIVPHVMPALSHVGAVRRALFRTLSQTRITYRQSALSEGSAGSVHAGDRLPWTGDNYAALRALDWRLHVYGTAAEALAATAAAHDVGLDRFPWTDAAESAGLRRDAAYLVRPDGHVGFASADADPTTLAAYLSKLGRPRRAAAA